MLFKTERSYILIKNINKKFIHNVCVYYRFSWARTYLAASEVTIQWDIPSDTTPGSYRIRHFGYAKSLFGGAAAYEGTSNTFQVV